MKFYRYTLAFTAFFIMIMGACTTVSAEEENIAELSAESNADEEAVFDETESKTGWVIGDDDRLYYFPESGESVNGLLQADGETYYIARNGAVKTGWYTVDGIRMFFDLDTGCRKNGWIDYMGERFYADPDKGKLVGRHEINGMEYIFDEQGKLCVGWAEIDDTKYYCNDDGVIAKGNIEIDGIPYLFSSSGIYQCGWQTVDGKRVFYDYEMQKPLYGWIKHNGYIYYADESTGKYIGDWAVDGNIYRFSDKGCLMLGFQKFNDGTRYYNDDGTIAKGFLNNSGKKYYFDNSGLMQTGFTEISGKKYYFDSDGAMQTGLIAIDGDKYYFDSDGIMKTGWQTINSKKYYFKSDGKMAVGLYKIGSDSYYFGSDGIMKTGWQTINSKEYYFKSDGKMTVGFLKIGSDQYYFDKSGVMLTGWQKIGEKRYFFKSNGALDPEFPKVFVGVGHGGVDSGAVKYIVEKEYTLKTGKLVAEHLKNAGIEFIMSRDADIDTTMEGKLKLCNDYDPDLIIDIHFNAVGGHGFEVYYSMYGGMSLTLAENINAEVSKFMYSNGCKTFIRNGADRFTIIRETNAPSVLIEGGFVDDWDDAQFIKANYDKLAKAYADGILKTLDIIMANKN
ncbi:MAG: N-acetylmuramoyl-L-alanine amidase [Clostridium sp.]|nr:N-acetylmuramoyl-L-alanine amidase [Clostridium sp.]MCM1546984.1 N-acetylmuramoyl-L-alanine amidase [Ruminococcus sp.]